MKEIIELVDLKCPDCESYFKVAEAFVMVEGLRGKSRASDGHYLICSKCDKKIPIIVMPRKEL